MWFVLLQCQQRARRTIIAIVCVSSTSLLLSACSKTADSPAPGASVTVSRRDRLAPGELAPGEELAFGLRLPQALKVIVREPFLVQSEGRVIPERVTEYLRGRLDGSTKGLGLSGTVFDDAVVLGTTGPTLRVEVIAIDRGTRLVVRDKTPPKEQLLPKEEMLRIHGYDSEGTKMDPSKFE